MADAGDVSRVLADRYELRERVGRGGMGEVWLGHDRVLNRAVAVKMLLPELSAEPTFRRRFEVEARAAAALNHPNVVSVYDVGETDGAAFIVMERLPGPSLDGRLSEGTLDQDEAVRVAEDVLAGLGAAHDSELVHRDVKPGNILRSAGKRWKVGDFGVAKDLAADAELTLAGAAVGTPAYLAPEQLLGHRATPATDLWATGVVLYEALTGLRPFHGETPLDVAHAVVAGSRTPLASLRPDLAPALVEAVERALARDPADRFGSAGDMADAIAGKPVPSPLRSAPIPIPLPVPATSGTAPDPLPRPPSAQPSPRRDAPSTTGTAGRQRRRGLIVVAVAALVAVMVLAMTVGALLLTEVRYFPSDDGPPPPTTETPGTAPTTGLADPESRDTGPPAGATTTIGGGFGEPGGERPGEDGPGRTDPPPATGTDPTPLEPGSG